LLAVACIVLFPTASVAQGGTSARDVQTNCLVSSVPNAERLTVSWTGDCNNGLANGVGNVIAFSAGQLRYILRGQFRAGQLERQDLVLDCAGNACADDVPPSLLRVHERAASSAGVATSATPTNVPPVVATAEIRAPDAIYKGRFSVDAKFGQVSGEGRVEFFDGRSFQGVLREGRKTGAGTYVWADGQRYVGNWQDDLQHGQGEWSSRSGERYVGTFRAGQRDGSGKMVYANGMSYEGDWRDGQQHGRGILSFPNGDVYEGDFQNGERTGTGTYRQKSGDMYSGQWLRGERDGKGVAEWANGQRYEGAWKGNRKEGIGTMRYADGGSYEGEWRDDRATGKGEILFASGDTYTGLVRDGIPHGNGIFRWGSGDRFEGEFESGKPTARGEMTFLLDTASRDANGPSVPPPTESAPPAAGVAAAEVSRTSLCFAAFNSANTAPLLKRFLDSFPDDECGRHSLAKQKIAVQAERERAAARAIDERTAQARALIGGLVAFRQEFPFCVSGTGSSCQRVTYVFDVKAKIREINVQARTAQVVISDVVSLANEKGAPPQLFAEGRSAATAQFKARAIGATQSKRLEELGLAF
jgi:hypothetical protein